ncbi:MAG: Gfo/Idh/MocA family protein [Armatimonadota bacterium]
MAEKVRVVLIAIGGYGANYVRALLGPQGREACEVVGVVDPFAARSEFVGELDRLGVPVYNEPKAFFEDRPADLAVISSPIHLHCRHTCEALTGGSHVLCEKPVSATVQEARRMMQARDAAGRFVSIGYQWSFSEEIQALKRDILRGRFGKARRLKCLCLSPRDDAYYGRNDWAGALRVPTGEWVLDSPIHNAVAHYLHNMLYVLGDTVDRSAVPADVTAELYRVNPITNFDTGVARIHTAGGAEMLFYASHAVPEEEGCRFVFEFERATVEWVGGCTPIRAVLMDGGEVKYPVDQSWGKMMTKLWHAVDSVRTGATPLCGLEAALAQTVCMNGMLDSAPAIVEFPARLRRVTGEPGHQVRWVQGLAEQLTECYDNWTLPHEEGVAWAVEGKIVDLTDYRFFPGGSEPS